MWVHLAIAGPGAAWQGMVVDPVFHLRAGRELPRPPSWGRLDGALQAIAETMPPWWRLPHLAASQRAVPVVLARCCVGTAGAARRSPSGGAARGRSRRARRRCCSSWRSISVGILPQALQRPGLDPPHVGDVRVVAVRRRRRRRGRAARGGRGVDRAGGSPSAPPSPLVLTFAFTSLFTFRYYLLHTRVGLGQVPQRLPGRARRPPLLLRRRPRLPRRARPSIDDLDRLAEPGERLLRRAAATCAAPGTATRSSTGCSRSSSRRPTSSRWIPAWPTPTARASPTTSPSADWVILTVFWDGWHGAQHLDGLRLRRAQPGHRATSSASRRTTRTASSASTTAAGDADARLGRHPSVARDVPASETLGTRRSAAGGGARRGREVAEHAEHGRSVAGTHTVRRPARSAFDRGVGDRRRRGGERRRLAARRSSSSARSRGARRARWRRSRRGRRRGPGRSRRGRPSTSRTRSWPCAPARRRRSTARRGGRGPGGGTAPATASARR